MGSVRDPAGPALAPPVGWLADGQPSTPCFPSPTEESGMAQSGTNGGLALPFPPRSSPGLARRVRDMVLLWLVFGALFGAGTMPPGGGLIGLVSFVLAGMIVMP